ncbi:DNA-binding HxlR family transcriptional regulator [Leucobacter exalbidus]|uniref:DNA-binding HxlR family transcriptional regulator n=1 Tax=Leucobacter exalbidus TaxID=662960 RepID=A0A940T2J6_9MICO|nr:helix-turn-helix domain-containing protein [Leucobacter exalbidus]MBP1324873.1 DNA-binding HxlR family transcriptional regulator [Leucobacter exalbidus]
MPRKSPFLAEALENRCGIVRSLGVLTDAWSFLLVREALLGRRTFAEFRESLGIASDVLTARLAALVEQGVFERVPYQAPGHRAREAYELTAEGEGLKVVLVAMQQWGEANVPVEQPGSVLPRTRSRAARVRAVLIDEHGDVVENTDVALVRAATAA